VKNLERGGLGRKSQAELSALNTLRGWQEGLVRAQPERARERKAPERAWDGEKRTPEKESPKGPRTLVRCNSRSRETEVRREKSPGVGRSGF
jgi:hypothetical protein